MDTIFDGMSRLPAALALDVAAKSTLILAASGAAALALRPASAATRHLAWCLGLWGALALPGLALCVPGWAWPILPARGGDLSAAPTSPRGDTSISGQSPKESAAQAASPALAAGGMIEPSAYGRSPSGAKVPENSTAAPSSVNPDIPRKFSPWTWLAGTWSAVALLILAVPLVGRMALWRLSRRAQAIEEGEWTALLRDLTARLGLSRRVALLRSRHALMPMTWGGLRPVVLLPADADSWPVGRRRDVLLHELAHIQRRDCLTQAIAQVACAVYWFNPLVWIASHRLRIEREHACDDIVLLAGSRASDYAEHLLDLARSLRSHHRHALAALAMARPSHLEGRLASILEASCPRRGLTRPSVVFGLIAMAGLVLPLSAVRLGARPAEARAVAREDEAATTPLAGQARPATTAPKAAREGESRVEPHRTLVGHVEAGQVVEARAEPRRTVVGRVVDAQGQPIPGARVDVIAESRRQVSDGARASSVTGSRGCPPPTPKAGSGSSSRRSRPRAWRA